MSPQQKIALYQSLFKGRDDVYARKWKTKKSKGWSPAYSFNWAEFQNHKASGGTLHTFENKSYEPLSQQVLLKHFQGKHHIGVYPILSNNTSHFIAADFDKKSWREDVQTFVSTCKQYEIPAYTEISQSGNGAHVWIFFENEYPCYRSRKIILTLLSQAFPLRKSESFDRLFPNQDSIVENGLGNLIALPLNGLCVSKNTTVFYNSATDTVFENQWDFLLHCSKVSTQHLDHLYEQLSASKIHPFIQKPSVVTINESGFLSIHKSSLSPVITEYIKERLHIFNTAFAVKKNLGKPVHTTEKYFDLVKDDSDFVLLPRGFRESFISFLTQENISFNIEESYPEYKTHRYENNIQLKDFQITLVDEALKHKNGIIVAPPGSGKTIVALEIITKLQLPTLIIVNRTSLLEQWAERINQFLGITKTKIGVFAGNKKTLKPITVATMQSLTRATALSEIQKHFGVVIVDECHHIPAKTYRDVLLGFQSMYYYGLTATHEKQYQHERITELCIGSVIAQHVPVAKEEFLPPRITILQSNIALPFRYHTDHYEVLANMICFDSGRNTMITDAVKNEVFNNKTVLILTKRKLHIEALSLYIRTFAEVIILTGDDSAAQRKRKQEQLQSGEFQVVIATGQLIGEGIDLQEFDTLVLGFPIGFVGKLTQYIGRLRNEGQKHIIDIRDEKIAFLERQYKKREQFYRKNITLDME